MVFPEKGRACTAETLKIAVAAAKEKNLALVVASSKGSTGLAVTEEVRRQQFEGPVIVVSLVFGWPEQGVQRMPKETMQAIKSSGARLVTAAHALSGAERGIGKQFPGAYPVEIIAHTLRMFGPGTKVAVECGAMAFDAGLLKVGTPIVSVGGSGGGADTALILTPCGTAQVLDTVIHEYLCKPGLY
ncbi:MAG: hypothetical protein IJP30_04120 [Clostridia bacterium]|nr:hypothetical protein [Clostridia bacterium]MBQ9988902.1 hypothetical protein [Clostridia bacterium]